MRVKLFFYGDFCLYKFNFVFCENFACRLQKSNFTHTTYYTYLKFLLLYLLLVFRHIHQYLQMVRPVTPPFRLLEIRSLMWSMICLLWKLLFQRNISESSIRKRRNGRKLSMVMTDRYPCFY